MKERIQELRAEKNKLSDRISKIDQEIYLLQTQCKHRESDLSTRGERTLEPRYAYDQAYAYDSTGVRIIEIRTVVCNCCGKSWSEMRYTDGIWMESFEWEKHARETQ